MAEREKVVRGLECCKWSRQNVKPEKNKCDECPYKDKGIMNAFTVWRSCTNVLAGDALALLKAQEARVMTLEELRDVGRVWKSSAPPFLWLDKNRAIYNSIGFWCPWRDIYEMIHGRHDKYTDENYGSEWRCWTSCPTPEQTRETKWEGESV